MADHSKKFKELQDIANKLRIDSINATNASNSGHPTSCASMAEIMSVLFFHTMKYKVSEPLHKSNDRFVLSKGHAAPILYSAVAEAGLFPVEDLLNLRKLSSDLEGHPTPRLNFIDVATGSLGQGLSVACGMAYVGKYFDQAAYRTFVLLGDGECAEGSVWEALNFASFYKLDNLCIICDVNRLGQSGPTSLGHNMDIYRHRFEAFGINAIVVDGHDVVELAKAFSEAEATKGKPTAIIAKTFKGHGLVGIEDMENWHGKPLGDKAGNIINNLYSQMQNKGPYKLDIPPVLDNAPNVDITNIKLHEPPKYKKGESIATRLAYGTALASLAKTNGRVVALDGDTKNSTFSDKIMSVNPKQHIECFIAEQNLVGVAIGAACRNRCVTFASTFATFFTRAFDQIRVAAISMSNANFVGSHCGVSIGEDGPSQMGLEDLALFRSIPGSTVFYPSDAVSCARAVELAANTKGICYIRTSRPNTAILYDNEEEFKIGKSFILKQSKEDKALVIGAGVTLHEALRAAEQLEKSNIKIRVMDLFTVKPIDVDSIKKHAEQCNGKVIVVEEHYPQGGIGEAVSSACAMSKFLIKILAVNEVPRSGPPQKLLEKYGIDSGNVVKAVEEIIKL
ncbi:transketolase [Halyomorpha halys]|uniref:transketolase n=1 Tax=Halyomorpha halys TaxID=286706 RepID=UPI0006D4FBEC|nr:transketolase [Halyomorpha halys]